MQSDAFRHFPGHWLGDLGLPIEVGERLEGVANAHQILPSLGARYSDGVKLLQIVVRCLTTDSEAQNVQPCFTRLAWAQEERCARFLVPDPLS